MSLEFETKPQILIYLTDQSLEASILPVLYGLEEEEIPFRIEVRPKENVVEIAYEAACQSALQVGIGVDGTWLVLHYKNLQPNQPYLKMNRYQTRPDEQLKYFGSNSAALVKQVPFRWLEELEVIV